jgi:hypothetical protein
MSDTLTDTQLRNALAAARACLDAGHDKAALTLVEALVENHKQLHSVPLLQMCVGLMHPHALPPLGAALHRTQGELLVAQHSSCLAAQGST